MFFLYIRLLSSFMNSLVASFLVAVIIDFEIRASSILA